MKVFIAALVVAMCCNANAAPKKWPANIKGCWEVQADSSSPEGCAWMNEIGATKEEFFKYTYAGFRMRVTAVNTTTVGRTVEEQYVMAGQDARDVRYYYMRNGKVYASQD